MSIRFFAYTMQRQQGLTLVEILVALVISAFLMAGVIQLFIGTKQTYRSHDSLSRIQENGRFALDLMSKDIRMAGYTPAWTPGTTPPPPIQPPPVQIGASNRSIQVLFSDPGAGPFECPTGTCDQTYSITCSGGETPPCTGIDMGNITLQSGAGTPQALIDGVADMRITPFWNDANSNGMIDATETRPASIQVDLLLVSTDRFVAIQDQTVNFPPGTMTNYTAPDRRLVQVFSTTIALRN